MLRHHFPCDSNLLETDLPVHKDIPVDTRIGTIKYNVALHMYMCHAAPPARRIARYVESMEDGADNPVNPGITNAKYTEQISDETVQAVARPHARRIKLLRQLPSWQS